MILHQSQKVIAKSRARFRVVNAGRRFGKSVLASEEMKGVALSKPTRIAYIAPTIQQARDIMWDILKRELRTITKKANESRLELEVMDKDGNSSFIFLKGWEAVETLRGQSFDLLVLDEVASMRNFWVGWNEVLSPTLIDRKGSAMFISTPKGFNHFYDLYNLPAKDSNYEAFHYTTYDNPNIPVEEIEREKNTKPENTFAQEYMADFRKQEGLVYKEFSRDRHVINTIPDKEYSEYIAGIDFGFTNPTAVIHIKRDRDENYFVIGEWYKTQRTDEQVGDYVQSCHFNRVYPDPESPSTIEVLVTKGVNVVEVVKNKDSIKNGITRVSSLLKQGKLFIHSSCVNLISEFETYAYPEKRPDKNEEENPIKEHDHALDALRYAISTNKADNVKTPEMRARQYMEADRNIRRNSR